MRYPTYQSLLGDFKRYLAKAGPVKTTKTSAPKLKFKGMKPKMSLSATGPGNTAPLDGEVADLQPIGDLDGEEEEKKSMGVGAMVGLVVGGVVLVILLVAGGLWWYMSSVAAEKEERNEQMIAEKQTKARQSIQKTIKTVQEDYADFHKFVLQGDAVVSQTVEAVQKVVPEELKEVAAEVLSPPPTPMLEAAIAYTNRLFSGAVPPSAAEAQPAATNATEAATAEKKDEEKKADDKKTDEKKADDKKADDKKADEKKADDKKADEKKADDKKADEKKADDKKADEKKADDKKTDGKKS